MPIVTVEEALSHLGIPDTDETAMLLLPDMIGALGLAVENHLNEVVELRQFTEKLTYRGQPLVLSHLPVVELVSIVSADGVTTLDVDDYDVTPNGVVYGVTTGIPATGRWTVTYTAGYATIPANYKQGALVVLEHLWEPQRGVSQSMRGVVGAEESYDPDQGTVVPRKAEAWLGPRQVSIA